jgi:dynein heavy chain 1
VHKTVKEALDIKQTELREFPNRMRSYQIYECYTDFLKSYKKVNDVLADLRNDAMKPKHWKDLLSKLRITVKYNDLTLNDLWCADLLGRSKAVNDVLT